jgi:hypothetical protein
MSSVLPFSDPALTHAIFAYQQTKRLSLLLDQLRWSLDLEHNTDPVIAPWRDQLCMLIEEAKQHTSGLGILIKQIAP